MKIAFRVDSGRDIGAGHLSRCITLANALKSEFNAHCIFIMRGHEGNHLSLLQLNGFDYELLPLNFIPDYFSGNYQEWVGDRWEHDAELTEKSIYSLIGSTADLLIVDHYGLDKKWEEHFIAKGLFVGVIDDLVNRQHSGSFLIDQTCGRKENEYRELVPSSMQLFTGENYCLLRPEFLLNREASLVARRKHTVPQTIMVNFGSTDPHNHTSRALIGLLQFALNYNAKVLVVVGSSCPHISTISDVVNNAPYECELLIDVQEMAKLMVNIDLAIGAAGATTWERCILGIPTLLLKTAENQTDVIQRVIDMGAAKAYFGEPDSEDISKELYKMVLEYQEISKAASKLVNGNGMDEIVKFISVGV